MDKHNAYLAEHQVCGSCKWSRFKRTPFVMEDGWATRDEWRFFVMTPLGECAIELPVRVPFWAVKAKRDIDMLDGEGCGAWEARDP